jgi:hypothetical protein
MGAQYFCKHIPLSVPFAVVHGIPSVLMLCGRITNFLSEETQVNEQSSVMKKVNSENEVS